MPTLFDKPKEKLPNWKRVLKEAEAKAAELRCKKTVTEYVEVGEVFFAPVHAWQSYQCALDAGHSGDCRKE